MPCWLCQPPFSRWINPHLAFSGFGWLILVTIGGQPAMFFRCIIGISIGHWWWPNISTSASQIKCFFAKATVSIGTIPMFDGKNPIRDGLIPMFDGSFTRPPIWRIHPLFHGALASSSPPGPQPAWSARAKVQSRLLRWRHTWKHDQHGDTQRIRLNQSYS